tara:strand:- start:2891 stop:3967 length:1077 start_codon:yes stop_codon:yes gene_type:complete
MNINLNSVNFSGDGLPSSSQIIAENYANLPNLGTIEEDMYSVGGVVSDLEKKFSEILNKEQSIFLPTGTMANHFAIRSLSGQNSKVIVQEQSHIYQDSGDTLQTLSGINLIPLGINKPFFTLDEIKEIIQKNSVSRVPKNIGCISIESPVRRQKGQIITIQFLEELHDFASNNGIKLHLDAARLYMMTAASKISIHEYTKYFDTVYVSLWKYFGAPWGAILSGSKEIIENLFNDRRMFGGSIPNSSLNAALILNNVTNFEKKMNQAYDIGLDLFTKLNDSRKFNILIKENHSNVFEMEFQNPDSYKILRSRLINHNIYLPNLDAESYGIVKKSNFVDLRINISILNKSFDSILKTFLD